MNRRYFKIMLSLSVFVGILVSTVTAWSYWIFPIETKWEVTTVHPVDVTIEGHEAPVEKSDKDFEIDNLPKSMEPEDVINSNHDETVNRIPEENPTQESSKPAKEDLDSNESEI